MVLSANASPPGSCGSRRCRARRGMSRSAGTSALIFFRNARNSWVRWRACSDPMTLPGGQIQRGIQARGAVADVVVAGPRRGARQHREHRLGAVERLDLGLLIDAEHHRPFRRVQVEPDHVADLLDEQRILGQFPRILFVRSQSERPPHPRDHRLTQSQMLGHRPRRPMRGIGRRGLQRRGDQLLDPLIANHPRPARPRLIEQTVEAIYDEPIAPLGAPS